MLSNNPRTIQCILVSILIHNNKSWNEFFQTITLHDGSAANQWGILLIPYIHAYKTPAAEKYTITGLTVLYKMLANPIPTDCW